MIKVPAFCQDCKRQASSLWNIYLSRKNWWEKCLLGKKDWGRHSFQEQISECCFIPDLEEWCNDKDNAVDHVQCWLSIYDVIIVDLQNQWVQPIGMDQSCFTSMWWRAFVFGLCLPSSCINYSGDVSKATACLGCICHVFECRGARLMVAPFVHWFMISPGTNLFPSITGGQPDGSIILSYPQSSIKFDRYMHTLRGPQLSDKHKRHAVKQAWRILNQYHIRILKHHQILQIACDDCLDYFGAHVIFIEEIFDCSQNGPHLWALSSTLWCRIVLPMKPLANTMIVDHVSELTS